ncbi:hypothetical protein FJY94_01030 [Candidatus Kaiserbacteria bacterium]|nr:hypothetical protein [Candidatus Kaiserbacteria bacterium]
MRRILGCFITALACTLAPSPALAATGGATPSTAGGGATCSAGQRLSTKDDAVVQNGTLKAGVCYDPNGVGISQQAEEAKQFLITRYDPGPGSSIGLSNPKRDGIMKLNDDFAVRLATMMKAGPSTLRIISAYRTCEGQLAVNPNGYGGDCSRAPHTHGIAVDFNYGKNECSGATYQWVEQNAPRYNLGLYNQLHRRYVAGECNHIEPRGGVAGGTPGTPGTGATPSAQQRPYGAQVSPLGYGQQYGNTAQGPCPYGYVFYNSQCYPMQSQQPLGGMQQYPMQQQPQQQQPYGSSGGSGYPSSGTNYGTATQGSGVQTGVQSGTSSVPNNQSIIDRLAELVNATTSTSTTSNTAATTTTPIIGTTSIAGIEYNGRTPVHMPAGMPVVVATNTITFGRWIAAQQTFGQPSPLSDTATSSSGGIRAAFNRIRQQLRMLVTLIGLIRSQQEMLLHLPEPQLIYTADVLGPQEGGGD